MGMFDSFIIFHEGKKYELQSNKFDSSLARYNVGDTVEGAILGSHVYLYNLFLDEKAEEIFDDKGWTQKYHVLICLSFGVYCKYHVIDFIEDEGNLIDYINMLEDEWKDSQLIMNVMYESIKRHRAELKFHSNKNTQLLRLINYAKNVDNKSCNRHLLIADTEKTQINKGKILDVLETNLEQTFSYHPNFKTKKDIEQYYL